ncbi:MAG: ParB/RepB/Spo0J family partition protein [Nitrospirota bacterium]
MAFPPVLLSCVLKTSNKRKNAKTDTVNITLDKLVAWEGNVRKTATDSGLEELAASIAAHGLLQSLVVRKHGKIKYAVVAGGRRLQAMQRLAASGAIVKQAPVPCQILASQTNATEISLAENTVREQMHPADEFEAFRELIDKGIPPADIAARFGVTETIVLKRLKLARVSPAILAASRLADLPMEQVMAFAVPDDQQQEYEALLAEYNGMIDTSDETDPQVTSRLDEIEVRMNELDDRATMWPPETLFIASAVVSIGHKGEPDIHRGFVLPEDKPTKQAKSPTTTTTDADGHVTVVETESAAPHSAALIESLTEHCSAAISAALLDRPDIAWCTP